MKSGAGAKDLANVLALSVHKNFWASTECEIFPNRLYDRRLFLLPGRLGSSRNPLNMLTLALAGYHYYRRYKPEVILFGAAPRLSGWFARLKRAGLLAETKLIAPGALYLNQENARQIERLYVFSRGEISLYNPDIRKRCVFIPLPADGDFGDLQPKANGRYIFAGGGAGRDFPSLIEAIRGLDIQLKIATFSQKSLNYQGELPANCQVYWRMPLKDFLDKMAGALFIVAPLQAGLYPHGHTTLVQALRLGKAVISTHNASIDDYVTHKKQGLLVEPGDVGGYRQAIIRMATDDELRQSCQEWARRLVPELTYQAFAKRLAKICLEVME
jgi:glycosyltransferase involved in cell wall biosynthesis